MVVVADGLSERLPVGDDDGRENLGRRGFGAVVVDGWFLSIVVKNRCHFFVSVLFICYFLLEIKKGHFGRLQLILNE